VECIVDISLPILEDMVLVEW
jgi:hypothetical protein